MTSNMIRTEYMMQDTPFPRYLPYPIFLMETDLSMTARVVYALLLNRMSLSQMNGWVDAAGRVFVIYTIESISRDIHKGPTMVKKALKELERADLLERRREDFGRPNHLFVKTVPQADYPYTENPYTGNQSAVQQTVISSEKRPYDGRETDSDTGDIMTTNNLIQNPEYRDINRIASLLKDRSEGKRRERVIVLDED